MLSLLIRFARDESGATAIEYGLIAALVAIVIVGALRSIGTNLSGTFGRVASGFTPASR